MRLAFSLFQHFSRTGRPRHILSILRKNSRLRPVKKCCSTSTSPNDFKGIFPWPVFVSGLKCTVWMGPRSRRWLALNKPLQFSPTSSSTPVRFTPTRCFLICSIGWVGWWITQADTLRRYLLSAPTPMNCVLERKHKRRSRIFYVKTVHWSVRTLISSRLGSSSAPTI